MLNMVQQGKKTQLFSPFEGLINVDINPQLQDKD